MTTALLGTTSWSGIDLSAITLTFIPSRREPSLRTLAVTRICPLSSTVGLIAVTVPEYSFVPSAYGRTFTGMPDVMNEYSDSSTGNSTSSELSSMMVQKAS